jgi:hypothetical protein
MAGSSVEFWNLPLELGSLAFGGGRGAAGRSLAGEIFAEGNFQNFSGRGSDPADP